MCGLALSFQLSASITLCPQGLVWSSFVALSQPWTWCQKHRPLLSPGLHLHQTLVSQAHCPSQRHKSHRGVFIHPCHSLRQWQVREGTTSPLPPHPGPATPIGWMHLFLRTHGPVSGFLCKPTCLSQEHRGVCSRTDELEVPIDSKGLQDSSCAPFEVGRAHGTMCPAGLKAYQPSVWHENCHLEDKGALLCPAWAFLQCRGLNLSHAIDCSLQHPIS